MRSWMKPLLGIDTEIMPFFVLRSALPCMLVLIVLSSCSVSERTGRAETPDTPAREFSKQDKMAARALSIDDRTAIENVDSPYAQAMLCRNGVESIAVRFRGTAAANEEMAQGMEQIIAFYDRRLRSLGGKQAKSPEEIRRDLQQTKEDNTNSSANARVAIACLRELQ